MKKDTIIRTIILALALVNQVFALVGIPQLEIDDDTIYQTVTLLATIGSAAWAWWKNNSFTKEAQYADDVLRDMKRKSE